MNTKLTGIVIAAFFTAGCAATKTPNIESTSTSTIENIKPEISIEQKEAWTLMVGKWFGSQPTRDGGNRMWIVQRNLAGQYRIDFKTVNAGEEQFSTEVGIWGVADGIYFTVFQGWLVNGEFKVNDVTDPYNRDVYKILTLNTEVFEYQSLSSEDSYTVKKVANNFVFPE